MESEDIKSDIEETVTEEAVIEEDIIEEEIKENKKADIKEDTKADTRSSDGGKGPGTAVIVAACAVIVVLIILIGAILSKDAPEEEISLSADMSVSEDVPAVSSDAIPVTTEELKEDAYPEVTALITDYFAARQEEDLKAKNTIRNSLGSREAAKIEARNIYVQEYRDLKVYTKPGPYEGSYIAFVVYELKLKDWEKTAPGLIALLICRDDDGLYVFTGTLEKQAADYIREVSSQDDVTALISKVDNEYNEILDSDADFAAYMNSLNELIKNSVGEILARSMSESVSEDEMTAASVSESDAVSSDAAVSANNEENEQKGFIVVTETKVNVRKSDSEDSEKLGQVDAGSSLTCFEKKDNGWSRVDYNGQTGYIKTEFLKGGDNAGSVSGKIRIKETIKIRATASTDGEVLGSAFVGEEYDVAEEEKNGWIGIRYNGKTAYVKAEYTES